MSDYVYVWRSSLKDRTSCSGFAWPESGPVEAPDWNPEPECGGGLHGLPWGEGCPGVWHDGVFQIVKVLSSDIVDLGERVKFPRGEVVLSTEDIAEATKEMLRLARTVGGVDPAIYAGVIHDASRGSRVTVGHYGTATAGDVGTATAGRRGTATAGDGGTATAGDYGTATARFRGTATAGDYGTAMAGNGGKAKAGEGGNICIRWYNMRAGAEKLRTAMVGYGRAVKPDVFYKINPETGSFRRAKEQ